MEHEVVEKVRTGALSQHQKETTKYPVGPWAMAFFAFVIVGSSIFGARGLIFSSLPVYQHVV